LIFPSDCTIMRLLSVFLLFLIASTFALDSLTEFQAFVKKYDRSYRGAEYKKRFTIFVQNLNVIAELNEEYEGQTTFAINQFADLTLEEFSAQYLGFNATKSGNHEPKENIKSPQYSCPASSVSTCDWRGDNAVTGVKNQGQCGSCWAFSTTGSTEGIHSLSTGTLVSLSEQNLVDCSSAYGNEGCNGGLMDDAFKYIIANNGIDTESSYPYTGVTGTCHFVAASVGATLSSYQDVPSGNEAALTTDIFGQPISVAIDASHSSFQFYQSGVYYEPACSSTQLDHGVLAIGYGVSGSADYYIVKNSWGASWGMQGYIWMSRNRNNNCGIATMASFPLV